MASNRPGSRRYSTHGMQVSAAAAAADDDDDDDDDDDGGGGPDPAKRWQWMQSAGKRC